MNLVGELTELNIIMKLGHRISLWSGPWAAELLSISSSVCVYTSPNILDGMVPARMEEIKIPYKTLLGNISPRRR
jgi:hypothetical protein